MDDFDEEIFDDDDTIFGDDEVFDCMVLDELEKEQGHKKNSNQGCFGTLIIFVGIISVMTFGITKLLSI
jgi:hypothetical protein